MSVSTLVERYVSSGKPYWRGRLSTVDLLVLSAVFDIVNIIYFLTKRVTLMRRSTVLSFPLSVSVPWLLMFVYFLVWVAHPCCLLAPGGRHFCPASLPPEWHNFLFIYWITNLSLNKQRSAWPWAEPGNTKGGSITVPLTSCFENKNKNCQLSYGWFQTSQPGGHWYSYTSPFSILWLNYKAIQVGLIKSWQP